MIRKSKDKWSKPSWNRPEGVKGESYSTDSHEDISDGGGVYNN